MAIRRGQIHAAIVNEGRHLKGATGYSGLLDPHGTQVFYRLAVNLIVWHVAPSAVVTAIMHPTIGEVLCILEDFGGHVLRRRRASKKQTPQ